MVPRRGCQRVANTGCKRVTDAHLASDACPPQSPALPDQTRCLLPPVCRAAVHRERCLPRRPRLQSRAPAAACRWGVRGGGTSQGCLCALPSWAVCCSCLLTYWSRGRGTQNSSSSPSFERKCCARRNPHCALEAAASSVRRRRVSGSRRGNQVVLIAGNSTATPFQPKKYSKLMLQRRHGNVTSCTHAGTGHARGAVKQLA